MNSDLKSFRVGNTEMWSQSTQRGGASGEPIVSELGVIKSI